MTDNDINFSLEEWSDLRDEANHFVERLRKDRNERGAALAAAVLLWSAYEWRLLQTHGQSWSQVRSQHFQEDENVALLHDVACRVKHLRLSRPKSLSGEVTSHKGGFGKGFDPDSFDVDRFCVTKNDGSKVDIIRIYDVVLADWLN